MKLEKVRAKHYGKLLHRKIKKQLSIFLFFFLSVLKPVDSERNPHFLSQLQRSLEIHSGSIALTHKGL